jgi:Putative  PD-(D/E)XK family member, (DUF4420)
VTELGSDELTRAWAVLSPPLATELSSFPLEVTANGTPCRVALDREGRRRLLVPAAGEKLAVDDRPSVLTSSVRTLAFGSSADVYVDICCTEPELNPEFDEVVTDLLVQVDGASTPGAAAMAGLARWRRLFRSRLERGLTAAARIGLFAELAVLRTLLGTDPALPIDVWSGPFGLPHDFEAPRGCLEVKATGTGLDPVRINGIEQLATHDGRPLELVLLTVAPDPNGTTLTDLVDVVRTLVNDGTSFDRRLGRLGWQSGGTADTDPLAIADVLRIPVTADTPRLVPGSLATGALPAGIDGLSYGIDRAVLTPLSIPGGLDDVARSVVQ